MRIVLALLLSATSAAATPEEDHKRLDAGEVLVETLLDPAGGPPTLKVKAVIEFPPARVWRVIDDCNKYKDRMPRIIESMELTRVGNLIRCRTVFDSPWPMSDLEVVTRARHTLAPPRYERRWTLESGDYTKNEGVWVVEPFDEKATRTLLHYELSVRPKTAVPNFALESAQKNALPNLMVRLREVVAGLDEPKQP